MVVPSLGQGPFLERTLASIRAQRDVDAELVVVDGGSTDATVDVLERWADRIDVLIVEPDDGQADAIAKGLDRSSAPLVTWLNADDAYAGPAALCTLASWLDRRPDVDLVYGRRVWIDGSGSFQRLERWQPFDHATFRIACYLPQECALFRRDAYARVGGLDRSMAFAIDYDLWLRMLDAGSYFLSIPEVTGLFRVHEAQKTTARWVDVGLPEIAGLHRRHLGAEVGEPDMLSAAEDHRNGTNTAAPTPSRQLQHDVAAIFNGYLANVLEGRVLDRWPG